MKKRLTIAAFTIMMLLACTIFTGCGNSTSAGSGPVNAPENTDVPVTVSIVASACSNNNQISVNSEGFREMISDCAYTHGNIELVRADGNPKEYVNYSIPELTTNVDDAKKEQIAEGYVNEILNAFIAESPAVNPEIDMLKAIEISSNFLASDKSGSDKYLVIAGSGLSTAGYLNFAEDDLFNTPTESILSALCDEAAIPDLSGVKKVTWFYCGQVAAPQEELSELQKDKLQEIWQAVLEASGAEEVVFDRENATSEPYEGLPPVTTIAAASRTIDIVDTCVLTNEKVEFVGDTADFVNPSAAKAEIKKVADTLLSHPNNRFYVAGSTASGTHEVNKALSQSRASAVAAVLESYGVPASQLTIVGLGDEAPWRVNDIDSNGNLIEDKARQNRSVSIIDVNNPKYGAKLANEV